MAFRIHEITIHLMAGAPGPCMPASPDVLCPGGSCRPTQANPGCKGKSHKPANPQDDVPGGKKRSLDLLQAQLREALAPLPL
ncbi:MAG: hypothetical protein QOH06_5810 [Acidobacteriota bacterium]|jgi:hypothetical protein|nr:hypothetical protein [Acidobacteriota bacterium]